MGNDIGVIILLVLLIVSAFLLVARKLAKISGGKRMQKEKHSDNIVHILAPSVLGLCICAVCLCGMSWAWFTASTAASATTIRSATLRIEKVKLDDRELTSDGNGGYTITEQLTTNDYTLSFKATENSTATKGFCKISIKIGDSAETSFDTEDIADKNTHTETITVNNISNEDVTITVEPIWRSLPEVIKPDGSISIQGTGDQTQSNAAAATPDTAAAAVSSDPVDSTQSESASDASTRLPTTA
ncbi:MAG: hypothetical protein MR622_06955, partial [Clostridiales bacterium]|nr:hypothetical protein [Clostridiales bacterium]